MNYEIGISHSQKDALGRIESTVTIVEKDTDSFMGECLCSCTFIGLELDDAIAITKKYFITPLNKEYDRVSKVSH